MNQKFEKLKNLLKELFQLDQPDLDFGLYRIMHAKSAEVTQFLDRDLLPQVAQAFGLYKTSDKSELEKELTTAIAQAQSLGVDPESSPKVKDLRHRLTNEAVDVSGLESEVYDHLYSFFRRYYSEGDFLAKRVYKPGVYAIPYEGEEVNLYWANRDQYYIKTSEYLRDYAFRLRPNDAQDSMRVHFRLVDAAEGEHGNVKAGEGKDRVFILVNSGDSGSRFIAEIDGEQGRELNIEFEYRPATLADWPDEIVGAKKSPPSQKDLREIAVRRILAISDPSLSLWIAELGKKYSNGNGGQTEYTRLETHLNRYSARNTFDYFIHKDLGRFLRGELDFYIKNEVMHLDDVDNTSTSRVEQYLSKIRVIRSIAGKIIEFLAQLENFEKRLWLKKKFVVETNYCIALDSIPGDFYPEIAANEAQREEWVKLIAIDQIKKDLVRAGYSKPLSIEFLKGNPSLTIDTRHFEPSFTARLLEGLHDLSETSSGLLIHADNFQALNLLSRSHHEKVKTIYIDPPYNTDASAILYKNNYKNSSWLSLIDSRLDLASPMLSPTGIICFAIDDEEVTVGRRLLGDKFPKELGVTVVRANPQSRKTKGKFSPVHEYALFYGKTSASVPGSLEVTEKRLARYPLKDDDGNYAWMNLIRTGNNDKRSDRPKLYYPIYVSDADALRTPPMTWIPEKQEYKIHEGPASNEKVIYPLGRDGTTIIEKNWHRGHPRIASEPEEYRVRRGDNGEISIDFKTRMDEDSMPTTWWDEKEYASANYGASQLKELFGANPFDFPKALALVVDCLRAGNAQEGAVVLDFFGGSGTTAHAVIVLNREDDGHRKFVMVETGAHFDEVLLPRIKKVTYSPEWESGKPKRVALPDEAKRGPRLFKYIRLESYEDALNNLEIARTEAQQTLLVTSDAGGPNGFQEQYKLRYMLDVETRSSQSLLNVHAFHDPTSYKLKVKRPGSDESREVNVDLLETFNWLIGLTVKHIAAPQSFSADFERDTEKRLRIKGRMKQQDTAGPWWFRTVMGTTPDGRRTLIIWRKLTGNPEQDNLVLDQWFTKQGYSTRDYEFQVIYVNGDNNLENLKAPDDTWKVRLIEEDFHRLMFDTEGV
jgi:adenine-specific DNA-methyltransferase